MPELSIVVTIKSVGIGWNSINCSTRINRQPPVPLIVSEVGDPEFLPRVNVPKTFIEFATAFDISTETLFPEVIITTSFWVGIELLQPDQAVWSLQRSIQNPI